MNIKEFFERLHILFSICFGVCIFCIFGNSPHSEEERNSALFLIIGFSLSFFIFSKILAAIFGVIFNQFKILKPSISDKDNFPV